MSELLGTVLIIVILEVTSYGITIFLGTRVGATKQEWFYFTCFVLSEVLGAALLNTTLAVGVLPLAWLGVLLSLVGLGGVATWCCAWYLRILPPAEVTWQQVVPLLPLLATHFSPWLIVLLWYLPG